MSSLAAWLPWLQAESGAQEASSDTRGARHRDQPSLAVIADAFAVPSLTFRYLLPALAAQAGDDEAHLQRGCEAGVVMSDLSGVEQDAGEAEWPSWTDPWAVPWPLLKWCRSDVRTTLQGVVPWPLCQAARNRHVPCQKQPFSSLFNLFHPNLLSPRHLLRARGRI